MIFSQFNFDGCLSYIVGCDRELVGAVIDPSQDLDAYINFIRNKRLKVRYVIDTHTHFDHVSAAAELAAKLKAKTVMSSFVLKQRKVTVDYSDGFIFEKYCKNNSGTPIDMYVNDGDRLKIGSYFLECIYTPGHTLDSMSILCSDRVFTGDTLLAGQCGRTDSPGGNSEDMYNSIFNKLFKLPDNILVYPAHDYSGDCKTTIGHERKYNYFIKNMAFSEILGTSWDNNSQEGTRSEPVIRAV